jgi:hypothetical protein
LLAGKAAMRDHIFTCIKAAYALRRTFLHHGHSVADIRQVEDFLAVSWCFFTSVLAQQVRWPDAKAFGAAMEADYRQRFGDSPDLSKGL